VFLSLACPCYLRVEAPRVGLVGRGGLGGRLDVVVGASGGVGCPTPVVVPGQVTPRWEIEWRGRVARQEPDPTPRRKSPRPRREDEEQFPTGSIAAVDDVKTPIGT